MTIVEAAPTVVGGVDTHLDVHVAAALDGIGGLLAVESFPATAGGYRKLLAWMAGFGPVGVALTLTPARCNASMNAVRANAAGSLISATTRVGLGPIAIVPVTTRWPGVGSLTSSEVVSVAATVVAWSSTV